MIPPPWLSRPPYYDWYYSTFDWHSHHAAYNPREYVYVVLVDLLAALAVIAVFAVALSHFGR